MGVNGITNVAQAYENKSTVKTKKEQEKQTEVEKQEKNSSNTAAVYEKSKKTVEQKKVYQKDSATVERLMAEADKRAGNLRDLVEKMLLKQGQTLTDATDIYSLLREGKVKVNPETSAQAQKDIAEDGYWGVNQTSDRLVSFAKALTGGDPSKANEMINAVKKGFEMAQKAWGGELPGICENTMDAAISKIEAWRDSEQNDNTMDDIAASNFSNQAATNQMT